MTHVVEYAAKEMGGAPVQCVYRVINTRSAYAILPNHQQGKICLLCQRLRVREHSHGRCVNDNKIHFLTHVCQQLVHLGR